MKKLKCRVAAKSNTEILQQESLMRVKLTFRALILLQRLMECF